MPTRLLKDAQREYESSVFNVLRRKLEPNLCRTQQPHTHKEEPYWEELGAWNRDLVDLRTLATDKLIPELLPMLAIPRSVAAITASKPWFEANVGKCLGREVNYGLFEARMNLELFNLATVLDIQPVSDAAMDSPVYCDRLPWPVMWCEWIPPVEICYEHSKLVENTAQRFGILCEEVIGRANFRMLNSCIFDCFGHCIGTTVIRDTGGAQIDLDNEEDIYTQIAEHPDETQMALTRDYITKVLTRTFLFAVSLTHCKNVKVVQDPTVVARKKTSKFHGPKWKQYVLEIDGVSHSSMGRGGSAEWPVHMVRGHYKRYTPERPLLGKYSGSYWWNAAVRGKPSAGAIYKEYRVGSG